MSLYTVPNYLEVAPTTALLSETRPTSLSAPALSALNATLDELLQLFIHASLIPPTGSSPPSVNGTPPLSAGPLGPKDIYTTERFAAGVRRVLGPNLGKEVILEAELAVRELLKLGAPSLRGDGALRKGSFGAGSGSSVAATTQADDLFRLLREWVMAISGLGVACPPSGPRTLTNHLLALSPPGPPPLGTMSPQLTFIVALYAERCIYFLGDYLSRAVGRVTERGQNESAGLIEVEAAFAEDDTIWSWLRGMRVRNLIESEVASIKSKAAGTSSQTASVASSPGLSSTRNSILPSAPRSSNDSTLAYGSKRDRQGSMASSFGLGIADPGGIDSFEELMQSGKTMKVSLTPDRLRTVEKLGRSTSSRPQSMVANSSSMASLQGSGSPTSAATRRYQARSAVGGQGVIDEGEEGGRKGDALTAMLSTPPPWQEDDDQPRRKNSSADDPFGPSSVAMRAQDSQNSVQTMSSTMSSGSDVDAYLNQSPRTRQRVLKAKDERKDLAHERQINHDLADFFSNSPPPPSVSGFPSSTSTSTVREEQWSPTTATSPGVPAKKAKKGFGSFFSTKTSKKEAESNSSTPRRDSIASQSTGNSIGRKNSRVRLNSNADSALASAAAMRAAGFSDAAIRTASYSPPPNLAPSSPAEPQRRISKVSYSTAPPTLPTTGNERVSSIPLTTNSPRASPPAPATPADSSGPSITNNADSATRVVNGASRALTSPSTLATTSVPPAAVLAESSSLAPLPPQVNDPSPRISLAPSFKTAHEEDYPTPTVEKEKPTFGASPGMVAGAGIAALAGAASAALFGSKSSDDPTAESERPSSELKRSPAIPSGIAMASQELGYRSSNETLGSPHQREPTTSSISTTDPATVSSDSQVTAPVVANEEEVEGEESDEKLLEPSTTLEALKVRMGSAESAAECVALLDAFIARQSKEQVAPKTNGVDEVKTVVEQRKPTEEERRAELERNKEAAQQRMSSWISQVELGGGWSALRRSVDENHQERPVSPKSPLQMKPLMLVQEWQGKQGKSDTKEFEQEKAVKEEAQVVEV